MSSPSAPEMLSTLYIATSFGLYRIGGGRVYRGLSEVKEGGKVTFRPRKTTHGRRGGMRPHG